MRVRKNRLIPTLLVAATMALVVTACGGSGGSGDSGGGGQTATIGYSGPLSGGAALYGQNALDGINMAVKDLNEDKIEIDGEPVTFEVESLDDQYLPDEAATNAQRLVQQNGAPVVFIPHSGGIFAAQGINDSRSEFLIGAYSSDPAILEQNNDLTMMIPPRFDNYMKPFAETTMKDFGNKLGLIPTESEYGLEWTEYITEEWESQGGEVLSNNGVDYTTTTDYASPVTQALSEDPDVLFVGGPSQPTALVIEEARKQGFEGGFMIMDQAKFSEMEGFTDFENFNGSTGVQPVIESDSPGIDRFIETYKKQITDERPVVSEVAYNYQAMHIVAQAMKLAGTTEDPQAIRDSIEDAIPEVSDEYKVANYPEGFTEEGHLEGPVTATYIQDGEYTPLEVKQQQ
jgi:branched-chain amino acid transport system substrate-binding protein